MGLLSTQLSINSLAVTKTKQANILEGTKDNS